MTIWYSIKIVWPNLENRCYLHSIIPRISSIVLHCRYICCALESQVLQVGGACGNRSIETFFCMMVFTDKESLHPGCHNNQKYQALIILESFRVGQDSLACNMKQLQEIF